MSHPRPRHRPAASVASIAGSVALDPLTLVPPPTLKTQYPHVDAIADWRAQQSIRLLWDRVFQLEAQLQAATTNVAQLLARSNAQDDRLARVQAAAGEALARLAASATEAADAALGTDNGMGELGLSEAGATGDITGPQTVETAGKIVGGTFTEFPLLHVGTDTADQAAKRDELLDRMVWHLNQAGIPASRYGASGTPQHTFLLLLDALAPDGAPPVRQYAYQVISYDEYPTPMTPLMTFKGQTPGTTTTPDPGIPD